MHAKAESHDKSAEWEEPAQKKAHPVWFQKMHTNL